MVRDRGFEPLTFTSICLGNWPSPVYWGRIGDGTFRYLTRAHAESELSAKWTLESPEPIDRRMLGRVRWRAWVAGSS